MEEKRYIEVEGKSIEVPEMIIDIELFKELCIKEGKVKKDAKYRTKCGKNLNFISPFKQTQLDKIKSVNERNKVERLWKLCNKENGECLALRNKVYSQLQANSTDYDKILKQHNNQIDFKPKFEEYFTKLDEYKAQIISLFGKFYTSPQVGEILEKEYGITVVDSALNNFRLRYIDNIIELQEEYKRDYGEIRLTYKKSRLEELNELYFERKMIYNQTKQPGDYKLLLQTIEQIKREVEGDLITINGNIDINIEVSVQAHIHQELLKGLGIREIILARTAGRIGVNPAFLMSRLHNSFYKKFNGFSQIDMSEEISYPSEIIYDFNKISELNRTRVEEQKSLEIIPIMDAVEVKEAVNLKEKLLELLKTKQNDVKKNQNMVEKYPEQKKKH